jgi:Ca2+-binding EF-hand superfamily protein
MRNIGLSFLLILAAGAAFAQDAARRDDLRREFDRRDVNHDGRLSREEYDGHPGNFRALDCDSNGFLSEREFTNRNDCGPVAAETPAPGQRRFRADDTNDDGVLSRGEWRDESISFHRADRNGDGVVTLREYADLPGESPEEARFERADTDNDGVLSRREWKSKMDFRKVDRNDDGAVTLHEFLNPPPGEWREARFEDMDHNDNGVISRWEWHGDRQGFERRDRNDDGLVTEREFLEYDKQPASSRDARFRELDRDRDSRVSRTEWGGDAESFLLLDDDRNGFLSGAEYARTRDLDRRFRLLDRDANGRLARDEWLGERDVFRRLDRDRDEWLSRDEFNN